MFAKNHFLNILCYFSVISIFALQYFDKIYIKFCEIIIAASIVLDILWSIVHSSVNIPLCRTIGIPPHKHSTPIFNLDSSNLFTY